MFKYFEQYIESPLSDTDFKDDQLDEFFSEQVVFCAQQRDESSADNSLDLQRINRNDNEMKPDVISNAINGSNPQSFSKPDIISIQESLTHGYHKPIARTVSLGSWQPSCDAVQKQSGRFSVSPVNLESNESESSSQFDKSPVLDIIDVQIEAQNDDNSQQQNESNSLNKESNSETTDLLMELPKNITKNQTFLSPESPYNRNIRRMSSPNLSQNVKPKVRPLNEMMKQCINLESLDLKSSLPISPTFFARFG